MKRGSAVARTIDEYIASAPKNVQRLLADIRAAVRKAAPSATEKISYRMPTFYYNGNLVHFAAYEHHIGFYATPSAIVEFADELRKYHTSKGAIQFPIDEPLPLKLIARIVKFRVRQNAGRGA
jgi:uncharacterized protein YdhG (YjbR/CyaY superfamily)